MHFSTTASTNTLIGISVAMAASMFIWRRAKQIKEKKQEEMDDRELKKSRKTRVQFDLSQSWVVLNEDREFQSKYSTTSLSRMWYEPDSCLFQVRGLRYQEEGTKIQAQEPVCRLFHVDVFETQQKYHHIATEKRVHAVLDEIRAFVGIPVLIFLVNLQLSENNCIVTYWVYVNAQSPTIRARNSKFQTLLDQFLDGTDEFRNDRFKLIPAIRQGPWAVQQLVGNVPVLLGKRVDVQYFKGDGYFEVDVNVSSSMLVKGIVQCCQTRSQSITVDLAILLQAETVAELPERVLGSVCFDKMDFKMAEPI